MTTTEKPELLPCPFCGGEAKTKYDAMGLPAFATCADGECVNDLCIAVSLWNRRANLTAPVTVKKLEWESEAGWRWRGCPPDDFFACVAKWVWEIPSGGFKLAGSQETFDTAEEAKAAAQADFERRARSLFTQPEITTTPSNLDNTQTIAGAAQRLLDDFEKIGCVKSEEPDAPWQDVFHAMNKDYSECGWTDWPSIMQAALRALIAEQEQD